MLTPHILHLLFCYVVKIFEFCELSYASTLNFQTLSVQKSCEPSGACISHSGRED